MTVIAHPIRARKGPWVVAVLVVLVSIAAGVLHSPWLSLHEVDVSGADRADVLGRVADLGLGDGAIMMWIDTNAVVEAVAADPWVADATAQRVFPDRLVIEVLERTPVVWIEGLASWMLVSADGAVLERSDVAGSGLLRARIAARDIGVGVSSDERVRREVIEMAQAIPAAMVLGELEFQADELWMRLPDHVVRLGTPTDLADKGRVAAAMLEAGVPAGAIIDVVAPRRPALIPAPPVLVSDPQAVVEGDTAEP